MTWTKLAKPALVVGNFVRGFFHGAVDEVVDTFTDTEIIRFGDTTKMLDRCDPWENHLKRDGYKEINKALKKGHYSAARKAVDRCAKETADPSCITLLKMTLVEVCTKCTTLLKESLPKGIIIPK